MVTNEQVREACNRVYWKHIDRTFDDPINKIYSGNLPYMLRFLTSEAFIEEWESSEDLDILRSASIQLTLKGYIPSE